MERTRGSHSTHFEELRTVLSEVELTVNNVPLTYFNLILSKHVLTPNDFYLADSCEIVVTQQHF